MSCSEARYGQLLAPYLADPSNLFIISSDFCHWGSRFKFTFTNSEQVGWASCCKHKQVLQANKQARQLQAGQTDSTFVVLASSPLGPHSRCVCCLTPL